ncbi:MAG: hypothetical protein IPM85_05590 [Chitinophagaceae bacterium]|nr:hypothetical protein [Chitinophagaceae bacterium]
MLLVFMILSSTSIFAQKFQYSKPLVRLPSSGEVRLVADVGGFHHLIHFSENNKPAIHIYNSELQLVESLALNFMLPKKCDIRLLQLKDYYILYTHTQKPNIHQFLKITGDGAVTNISHISNNPADSLWNRNTATFQIFDADNNLVLTSLTYLKEIKKIRTAIIRPNLDSGASVITYLLFPFSAENEELKEVTFRNNYLHVLKNSKDENGNNTLTLLKLDTKEDKHLYRHFDSGKYIYLNPAIRFNSMNPNILVYSMLRLPYGYKGSAPGMFVASLDSVLTEIYPAKSIPEIFRGNTLSTFLVEKTKTSGWLTFTNFPTRSDYKVQIQSDLPTPAYAQLTGDYFSYFPSSSITNSYVYYDNSSTSSFTNNSSSAIRLTVLNSKFEKAKDSLVKNKGSFNQLHPSPHAQFLLKNTPCLLLVQELAANKKGLIMFYPNEKDKLESVSLNVYHPYNYLLPLTQPVGDKYFIVPYTDKKEIGLLKVTLNN